jgi:hypothetical protein
VDEIVMNPPQPNNPQANSQSQNTATVPSDNKAQSDPTVAKQKQTNKPEAKDPAQKPSKDGKDNNQKQKPKDPKKKRRKPIVSLMIILTIAMLGYKGYQWLDQRFKEQQKYINDNFAESVDYMLEESESDNYVRGLHDIKDPFEGWEHFSFHSLSMRYPPEISPEYTLLQKASCQYATDSVDFTSDEYRMLYGGYRPQGSAGVKSTFYRESIGFTICYFPNNEKLELMDFVNSPKTWLPDTSKYNGKKERSKIIKNWSKANVNRDMLVGYFYEGNLKNTGNSRIVFVQDLMSKEIYIIDLDKQYHDPDAKSTESMQDVFLRILTSLK